MNTKQEMMTANEMSPSMPIHPGEIIKDELEFLNISQKQLSDKTGISYTIINEIIHGKRQVSVEYALLIDAAINLDADMLIKTQIDYNKDVAMRDTLFQKRLEKISEMSVSSDSNDKFPTVEIKRGYQRTASLLMSKSASNH